MAEEITKSQALMALIPSLTLSGYKTYLAGIGLIVFGGYQIYSGNMNDGGQLILNGLGLMGARAAIAKSGPQPIVNVVADMVAKAIDLQPPCKEEPPNPTQPAG